VKNLLETVMPTNLHGPGQGVSQGLVRRLLANRRPQPGQAAGHPFVGLALAAGKDALRCAGKGWFPESDVAASAHPGQAILLELIGFKRIEIRVNPDVLARRAAALASAASADPLNIVLNAVRSFVRLFAGHYDTCPRDLWGHRRLVDAASWGAYRTYCPTESEMQIAASIASFFERTIVAYTLTRVEGADFVSGLATERRLNQHPFHLLWALFQRSQAVLLPAAWDDALKINPWEPDPAADALLCEVLFILFRARLSTVRGRLRLRGRIRCPAAWEWTGAVEALAELLAPYLGQPANSGPGQPNPFSAPGPHGNRPLAGQPIMDAGDLANPFLSSGDQHRQGSPLLPARVPLLGRRQSRGIEYSLELDDYYSRQAQSLQVKDGNKGRHEEEPELLPVGFLDYAPASLRDLACGQIDWFRTRRSPPSDENPSGLQLHRLTDPLEIPAKAFDPASRNVPNLLLVVDSSGSMAFNPQATGAARGRFDVVLNACWNLFHFLKERGLEDEVWVNAVNFSGATRSSGWHRGDALDPVKRVLGFYEGGGTTLDTSAIRSARESSPGRLLAVAMTDGCLSNTPAALEELRRTIEAGHSLVLLHIGVPNAFTEGVRRMGGSVHILNHAHELVGLCLDLAKATYGDVERH
jgi:hypothetical protein